MQKPQNRERSGRRVTWREDGPAPRLRMLPGAYLFLETSRDALLAALREDLLNHGQVDPVNLDPQPGEDHDGQDLGTHR